jgi:glycosyltransferase involved in cell wall biosynthesis
MTAGTPRVVFFPDSFHEVNGVANTSRQFEAFARKHDLPFLCIRAGRRARPLEQTGNVWTLELPRSFLAIPVEKDLSFDPAYLRHLPLIVETIERFQPDLIHITGPSELGILGTALAHKRKIPLAASWHTNLHEYAERRARPLLNLLPHERSVATGRWIEDSAMRLCALYYSCARVLYAPNPGLCSLLERTAHRPCYLMPRGVESDLFHPCRRNRRGGDNEHVLGFVGRLSVEKNVALLAQVQRELEQKHGSNFRFLIVGHGAEEPWLRKHLPRAEFTGVLRGEALATAYANMDLFVFPSHTDTFGNVVLEALSCGVPAIVTPDGGPATIVRDVATGRIVPDAGFAGAIATILDDPESHNEMRRASREYALAASWDSVFEGVYSGYKTCFVDRRSSAASTLPA